MTAYLRGPLCAAAITITLVSILGAASGDDAAPRAEFVQAQQTNAAALREYTWKSRTELSLKGDVKSVTLEQVRYDLDGRRQKTRIGGSPESPAAPAPRFGPLAPQGGPVRRIVAAKKKAEFEDLLRDLSALAESYAHPSLETLHAFGRQAAHTKTIEAGLVRVQSRNLVVSGDSMIVWIDPLTSMIRRTEITTTLEGQRVEVAADHRSLSNGLTYQARTLLRYPHKQMALTIETYDYQHELGGSR
jgi:hypothetical protein